MPKRSGTAADNATNELVGVATEVSEIAKTAHRNRKSLSGDNFYGDKFHSAASRLRAVSSVLCRKITVSGLSSDIASQVAGYVDELSSEAVSAKGRVDALRGLKRLLEVEIAPHLDESQTKSVPTTEHVLPLSVVVKTRTYFEKVVTQANGCYEHQWFDACSVMIRRFVETLIVELYEAKGIATKIKDCNGDFHMLQKLIDAVLKEPSWNLARETKKTLPLVKKLGDRSAHNRRYVATKSDVDEVIPGLRVVADDLLHLAGIK